MSFLFSSSLHLVSLCMISILLCLTFYPFLISFFFTLCLKSKSANSWCPSSILLCPYWFLINSSDNCSAVYFGHLVLSWSLTCCVVTHCLRFARRGRLTPGSKIPCDPVSKSDNTIIHPTTNLSLVDYQIRRRCQLFMGLGDYRKSWSVKFIPHSCPYQGGVGPYSWLGMGDKGGHDAGWMDPIW